MKTPLIVTFKDMPPSDALAERIREKALWLESHCRRMIGCQVVVEEPHKQHRHGNLFNIRIHASMPGHSITVNHEVAEKHSHEDCYVALRDAFQAARRQLDEYERKRRAKARHAA